MSYAYSSATVILPSEDCDAATYDFIRERDDFKKAMTELASITRDVILILHPSHPRSSVKRREKRHAERSLVTGVSRMIFLMAHFDSEGFEDIENVSKDFADFELEVCCNMFPTRILQDTHDFTEGHSDGRRARIDERLLPVLT
jgi:hypothetical protein